MSLATTAPEIELMVQGGEVRGVIRESLQGLCVTVLAFQAPLLIGGACSKLITPYRTGSYSRCPRETPKAGSKRQPARPSPKLSATSNTRLPGRPNLAISKSNRPKETLLPSERVQARATWVWASCPLWPTPRPSSGAFPGAPNLTVAK